jgi:hypothetical protein
LAPKAEPNGLARRWHRATSAVLYAGPTAQQAQAHAVLYSEGECTKRSPEALCNAPHPSTARVPPQYTQRPLERAALSLHCDATNSGSETWRSWACTERRACENSDNSGWGATVTPTPFCAGLYCPAPAAYTAKTPW